MSQTSQSAIFQTALRGNIPSNYVITFWKGRVALYGALKALGVGPGDGVIMPGYTCAMVPGAVVFLGAKPIYADIDPKTYSPSLGSYSDAFEANPRIRIKALILQHTYGIPGDALQIAAWARAQGMAVIEDCAHSLGTRYCDDHGVWQDVGSAGDVAIFSSQWSKPISTGLGGWVVTRNKNLAGRIARFHDEECAKPSVREVSVLAGQLLVRLIFSSPKSYWMAAESFRRLAYLGIFVGTNDGGEFEGKMPERYAKKMSGLQEWLLKKRQESTALLVRRRNLKRVYDEALKTSGLPVLHVEENADPVLLRYPVRVRNKPEVLARAQQCRMELGDWFNHPLHPREANAEAFGYRLGFCPEGERAAEEVVNLPLTERTNERIACKAVEFLKQAAKI
ncbi:MAG TPA: DegT/DnrJ/EryC1/StrS family aminotransferase [Candidatus Acidoferrales bacterium]|nr:DegT/DnrJ/EryC1/StrS family aminotransferase [Candidatus Acidoferrales bacterium]